MKELEAKKEKKIMLAHKSEAKKVSGGGKRRLRYSKIIVQLKIKCSKD